MPPNRGDRAAPPAALTGLDMVFATNEAASGWVDPCSQMLGAVRTAWDQLTSDPRRPGDRQHRMKGNLASGVYRGRRLEQWEHEVAGGARIQYLIDDDHRTARPVDASVGHFKDTE